MSARADMNEKATKLQGHGEPCYYCDRPCDSLAGNPGEWPICLSHRDDPGVSKWHHASCVTERLVENQPALPPLRAREEIALKVQGILAETLQVDAGDILGTGKASYQIADAILSRTGQEWREITEYPKEFERVGSLWKTPDGQFFATYQARLRFDLPAPQLEPIVAEQRPETK